MGLYACVSAEMWQDISKKEKEKLKKLAKTLNERIASDEEKWTWVYFILSTLASHAQYFLRWADGKFYDYSMAIIKAMYKQMGVMALVMSVRIDSDGDLKLSV